MPVKWAKIVKRNKEKRKSRVTHRQSSDVSDGKAHPYTLDSAHQADSSTPHTPVSGDDNLIRDLADETGGGLAKTGEAIAKAPMDLSLALAQGFHNAPRLYGDSTVRTAPRITGLKSGFHAAGKEFTLGVYDGITGLLMQPIKGGKEEGAIGAIKGVGKGVGGFVLKDIAALLSSAYILKGVHKELVKKRQPTNHIRRAKFHQGQLDVDALAEEELDEVKIRVLKAWQVVEEIRKEDEKLKKQGVKGRLRVAREQRRKGAVSYEHVGVAMRELKAKREGRRERQKRAEGGDSGIGSETDVRGLVLEKHTTTNKTAAEGGKV